MQIRIACAEPSAGFEPPGLAQSDARDGRGRHVAAYQGRVGQAVSQQLAGSAPHLVAEVQQLSKRQRARVNPTRQNAAPLPDSLDTLLLEAPPPTNLCHTANIGQKARRCKPYGKELCRTVG